MTIESFPKGCSGVCRPKKFKLKFFISYVIMGFCKYFRKMPTKYLMSHSFELGNKNEIHEANLEGVQKRNIKKYMNSEFEFYLFRNKLMTAEQYATGIAYSSALVGEPYDIPAFVKFVIKVIPQVKWAKHCSELQTMVIRFGKKLKWVTKIKEPHDVTPADAYLYALSEQGKEDGWELLFHWDGNDLFNGIGEKINIQNWQLV